MNARRIRINLAGRSYPLNVSSEFEEEVLRAVGKKIEEMVKDFEKNFSVNDKQDALAMCALKLGADSQFHKEENKKNVKYSNEKLLYLSDLLKNKRGA